MNYPDVILQPKREESVLFGHPWLFSRAVQKGPKKASIVNVLSHEGAFVGVASYNPSQSIALRIFDRERTVLDEAWFLARFQAMERYRRLFLQEPTYRLCFGESDGIPGLVVDRFGDAASLQINTKGIELLLEPIKRALTKLGITELYETTSGQEGVAERAQSDKLLWTQENGLIIAVRPDSQKTGWFCDQRENRSLLGALGQKTVLNLFSFSGGFALAALKGGSELVVNVDRDPEALALFDLMKEKNQLSGKTENHTSDCWDYLKEEKRLFDLVICDPPAFVKQAAKKAAALKGYKDIFVGSIKRVKVGGFLALFSCSHYMELADLEFVLRQAYQTTGRFFQTVQTLQQPFDHPVPAYFPEGRYIKGFLLKELA